MNSELDAKNNIASRYIHRYISLLDFYARILDEADARDVPIMEKVKFISIFVSNLDEFFMARMARIKRGFAKEKVQYPNYDPDEYVSEELFAEIKVKVDKFVERAQNIFEKSIVPELESHKLRISTFRSLPLVFQEELSNFFHNSVFPVLTPLAVDPSHPFPFLKSGTLYLLVSIKTNTKAKVEEKTAIAFISVPSVYPRLIFVGDEADPFHFVLIEDLIAEHLDSLFTCHEISALSYIKVTRNCNFILFEDEVVDLLQSVQKAISFRDQAEATRLEVSANLPLPIIESLLKNLNLTRQDVYSIDTMKNIKAYAELYHLPLSALKEEPFNPRLPISLKSSKDIFSLVSNQEILVHHPYESFYTVIEFLNSAAQDPDVLAIKQTLYRTSGDSPIISALIQAAERGKEVTALVELKARFDERNNIEWSQEMERAGVNVVFGFIGLKTHCKTTLVVRKENGGIKRFVHLSTGNYNSQTARTYVDIGLITANPEIGQDISTLFNLLTGIDIVSQAYNPSDTFKYPNLKAIAIAPLNLRERVIELIEQEIKNKIEYGKGLIRAKMNALVDVKIIEKLYEASQKGVNIELMVRGICCLRPQVPGLSENIKVFSIIDRFLEHSRIFYFYGNGQELVYLASSDWMTRNMDRRVEVMFPITDPKSKHRIIHEILKTYWQDNVKAKQLSQDGTYTPIRRSEQVGVTRAQFKFIEIARKQSIKSLPYEKAIRFVPKKKRNRPVYQGSE